MITTQYVELMAGYNCVVNKQIIAAGSRLTEAQRWEDRGSFWGSLQGTLNHLIWADQYWLSRLSVGKAPTFSLAESSSAHSNFDAYVGARLNLDKEILKLAGSISAEWLEGQAIWFNPVAERPVRSPRHLLLLHLFNHQTHHRGQAHTIITSLGVEMGDFDIPLLLEKIQSGMKEIPLEE